MIDSRKTNLLAERHCDSIAAKKRKWIKLAEQLNGYSYDSAGRLYVQTMPDGDTVTYELDANGNRTQLIWPDSYYAQYDYDQMNRLSSISLNGSETASVSFDYDQLSRRTQLSYDNGCVCNYAYALNNDMQSQALSFVGSSANFIFFYNKVHQVTVQVPTDLSFFWTPSSSSTVNYATANDLNQYPAVASTDYSYDNNGCLTGGPLSATFDTLNRMAQAVSGSTTNDYWYDPINRQAQKSVNGTNIDYLYDGQQLIATYDDSGDLLSRFITGDSLDEIFINLTDSGSTLTYLHTDRLGSVIAETDSSGAILNKFAFSPFGESSSVSSSNFGFTGQRFDSEIGVYNYKARYYAPSIGRFLQPDPLGYSAGDINLYSYVGNDAGNLTDSLGLSPDGTFYDALSLADPTVTGSAAALSNSGAQFSSSYPSQPSQPSSFDPSTFLNPGTTPLFSSTLFSTPLFPTPFGFDFNSGISPTQQPLTTEYPFANTVSPSSTGSTGGFHTSQYNKKYLNKLIGIQDYIFLHLVHATRPLISVAGKETINKIMKQDASLIQTKIFQLAPERMEALEIGESHASAKEHFENLGIGSH